MKTGCGERMRHGDRLKLAVFAEMLVTHRDRRELGSGSSGRLRQGDGLKVPVRKEGAG